MRYAPVAGLRPHPAATTPAASGRVAERLGAAFYAATLLVALAGATTAATGWLGWPMLAAAVAVAVVELGGVTLAARADHRRRLGEHAVAARLLSGTVAVFAVLFQWLGHADHRQGGFFAGVSALAYGTWLINSADRRRDQLRAAGKLAPTPPAYGLIRWLRHPSLTRRARTLALADPTVGLFGSLAAAATAAQTERRQAALAALLRRKIAEGRDRLGAEIAVTTYDLDEIAARLAAGADYDGLTALIAAELQPNRVVNSSDTIIHAAAHAAGANHLSHPGLPDRRSAASRVGNSTQDMAVVGTVAGPDPVPTHARTNPTSPAPAGGVPGRGADTAVRVALVRDRQPELSTMDIARRLGVTDRTVRRHLAAMRRDTAATVDTSRSGRPADTMLDDDPDRTDNPEHGRPVRPVRARTAARRTTMAARRRTAVRVAARRGWRPGISIVDNARRDGGADRTILRRSALSGGASDHPASANPVVNRPAASVAGRRAATAGRGVSIDAAVTSNVGRTR